MNFLGKAVSAHLTKDDNVLDLGCGILVPFGVRPPICKNFLGVDVFGPYLERIKRDSPTMLGELPEVCKNFLPNSWDVVLLLDILEHLLKSYAEQVIGQCEIIARKKIIIWTPEGFEKQAAFACWDLPYCPYQEHLCGFEVQELEERGYACELMPNQTNEGKITSILAIKDLP